MTTKFQRAITVEVPSVDGCDQSIHLLAIARDRPLDEDELRVLSLHLHVCPTCLNTLDALVCTLTEEWQAKPPPLRSVPPPSYPIPNHPDLRPALAPNHGAVVLPQGGLVVDFVRRLLASLLKG